MNVKTPAAKLVSAFGDPATMAEMYAPDVQWSLPASLVPQGAIKGKDAVVAFNTRVWTESYPRGCAVEILDETGDETVSAVRFIYRAYSSVSGGDYENEYTLFVRSDESGIREVNEGLDSLAIIEYAQGRAVGSTIRESGIAR